MTDMPKLRVLLADDHPVVLAGIKALLTDEPGLEIIGEANDGRTAVEMALRLRPDVLVIDLSMPTLNGIEATRHVLAGFPGCKVLVLTVHEDRSYLRTLLEVGAVGYLLKRSAAADLLRAIHAVAAGGIYLDPAIARQAIEKPVVQSHGEMSGRGTELSERELAVLRGAAGGHSNKAIAASLKLSVKSVETYKARGMEKLGLRSRADLVGYAVRSGWLYASDDDRLGEGQRG